MRDGILICRGKGNPEWNYSSAHGCGRTCLVVMLVRRLLCDNIKTTKDVFSSCICKETLDELPSAYKDPDFISSVIGDSVEIVKQLRPIINIKGY